MHLLVNENVILEESRFTPLVLLLEGFFGQLNSNNDVEFLLLTFLCRNDFSHLNFHAIFDKIKDDEKLAMAFKLCRYVSKAFKEMIYFQTMIFMKNSYCIHPNCMKSQPPFCNTRWSLLLLGKSAKAKVLHTDHKIIIFHACKTLA